MKSKRLNLTDERKANMFWIETLMGIALEDEGQKKITVTAVNNERKFDLFPDTGRWSMRGSDVAGSNLSKLCAYLYALKNGSEVDLAELGEFKDLMLAKSSTCA